MTRALGGRVRVARPDGERAALIDPARPSGGDQREQTDVERALGLDRRRRAGPAPARRPPVSPAGRGARCADAGAGGRDDRARTDRGAGRRRARRADRRRGRLRAAPRVRGLPHPPAVRRLARGEYEQKLRGLPYEEISRSGGGIRRRPARGAGHRRAGARPVARGGRRDAGRRDHVVRVQVRLRAVARGRAAGAAPRPRAGRTGRSDHPVDRAACPCGARRLDGRRVDGRGGVDDAGGAGARHGLGARHLRRVRRVRQRAPGADGAAGGRRRPGAALPRRAVRRLSLGAGGAGGGGTVGRPSVDDARRRHRPAGRRPVRRRAAAGSRVPGRRAPGTGPCTGRCGCDRGAGHRRQSRHRTRVLDAGRPRAGRAPVRAESARTAGSGHLERRLGARPAPRPGVDRGGQARRSAAARRAGRDAGLSLRAQSGGDRLRGRGAGVRARRGGRGTDQEGGREPPRLRPRDGQRAQPRVPAGPAGDR